MNTKLEIRRNSDGALACDVIKDDGGLLYLFEEGNARCDCNRELLFARARKEAEPVDVKCGEGRFSVRLSDADTGDVFYDEITPYA